MIENKWYIVCFERELRKQKLLSRTIVGKQIVAFLTASGKVIVLEDRCCHRNVHLSLGTVQGETIRCGYHGWEYGEKGLCTHIPSLSPEKNIPKTTGIPSFPVQLKHKIVWAFIGDPALSHKVKVPPLTKLDDSPFTFNYHVANANIELIAESLYDAHHIKYVHQNTIGTSIGDLDNKPVNYHLESTGDSMKGWYYRTNNRNIFEKIYFGFKKKLETHFTFWYPHTSTLNLQFPRPLRIFSRRIVIYQHFYEIEEGKCMIIQITSWNNILRFMPWLAKWFMDNKSKRIVKEDIAFLESSRKWHNSKDVNDQLIQADELSIAFLKFWNDRRHQESESEQPQKAMHVHNPN